MTFLSAKKTGIKLFASVLLCLFFLSGSCSKTDPPDDRYREFLLSALLPGSVLPETETIDFQSSSGGSFILAGNPREYKSEWGTVLRLPTGSCQVRFWNFALRNKLITLEILSEPGDTADTLDLEVNGTAISRNKLKTGWNRVQASVPASTLQIGSNILTLITESSQRTAISGPKNRGAISVRKIDFDRPVDTERTRTKALTRNLRKRQCVFTNIGGVEFFFNRKQYCDVVFVLQFFLADKPESSTGETSEPEDVTFSLLAGGDGGGPSPLFTRRWSAQEGSISLPVKVSAAHFSGPLNIQFMVSTNSGSLHPSVTVTVSSPDLEYSAPDDSHPQESITVAAPSRNLQLVPRNIVLVVLDAARPDHFGCYGYPLPTTPCIDRLSRRATLYRTMYAPSSYTLATLTSLFTGTSPLCHRIMSHKHSLRDSAVTVVENLRDLGFTTTLISASKWTDPAFGLDQGFEHQRQVAGDYDPPSEDKKNTILFPIDSNVCAEAFVSSLRRNRTQAGWRFSFVHAMQPHNPYASRNNLHPRFGPPCDTVDGQTVTLKALDKGERHITQRELAHIKALYDSSLSDADRMVGKVITALKKEHLWAETLLTIFADHGEAFGEHGRFLHNSTVYNEMIKVPFVIRGPASPPTSILESRLMSLQNLSASLFSLADGQVQPLNQLATPHQPAYDPNKTVFSTSSGLKSLALIWNDYKFLEHKLTGEKLFNLKLDPQELNNLRMEKAALAGYCRQIMEQWKKRENRCWKMDMKKNRRKISVEPSTRDILKALGYVDE